ncbi:MAG: acyl-CoA dehydrogenase [Hyphomicrobiales bacterium]
MTYRAPVADIQFALEKVAGFEEARAAGHFAEVPEDLVAAILEEAGKFATEEIAPLNQPGDRQGARLADGKVTVPAGFAETYRAWAEAGWNGLAGPEEFGGQGLPVMLQVATHEMWNSASMAFSLGPLLTIGAVEALHRHASDDLKSRYLEKLVTGAWTGTMNLTEPQAGSDLNALVARAEPQGDGTYRIFGTKIFITYGEHEMTDNIVHLVLARLPDAPAGTRGISLFLVPKFLPDGSRNDVLCSGIEHKLGIHGSPTCTMIYGDKGGATGWLIGEENRGLACMFTMMNNARLAVGIQGVAIAERAFQQALAYAHERRQGRAPGASGPGMSPIIGHADIRRQLMTMASLTAATRGICYACAHAIDMARVTEGEAAKAWQERANLLTPIAKGFSTDIGVEVASLGVQIHGGMGFIEETGAAQHYRDARIAPIYEGTNGIQAIDLVARKLPQSGGEAVASYVASLRDVANAALGAGEEAAVRVGRRLAAALDDLEAATVHITGEGAGEALAGATPYLRLFGLVAGGAYLVRGMLAAPQDRRQRQLALFYGDNLLPGTSAQLVAVIDGADAVLDDGGVLAER